jgi:hypothetical protein
MKFDLKNLKITAINDGTVVLDPMDPPGRNQIAFQIEVGPRHSSMLAVLIFGRPNAKSILDFITKRHVNGMQRKYMLKCWLKCVRRNSTKSKRGSKKFFPFRQY